MNRNPRHTASAWNARGAGRPTDCRTSAATGPDDELWGLLAQALALGITVGELAVIIRGGKRLRGAPR